MSNENETLLLADAIEAAMAERKKPTWAEMVKAAALLRRQHAEIESLKAERDEDRRREYGYSQQTVDALTKERDALRALLRYWLPDETMIPTGHEAKWNESIAAIDAAQEGDRDE